MSEESHPKTLYVGNLDHSVQEDLLCTLFSQIGPVKGCKIIREPGNDPYAFVEFTNHQSASTALIAMNKRSFLEKEMKVNWATSPGGNQPKTDTSNHYHIFVGDLSAEIETDTLREAFAPFGEISNCRIVRDPQTLKSKGYAFVSFVKKAEAETAIQAMNGQWLGSRSIRTNWSTRKPPPPRGVNPSSGGGSDKSHLTKQITFDEVYNQSSPTNTTVYFGGIGGGGTLTEDLVHDTFALYGPIQDIRVFKDKGYAFIKFLTKESATRAIECIHNRQIAGQIVKCFWGKEQPTTIQQQQQQQQQQQAQQQQQQQQSAQAQQQQQSQSQDAVTAYAAAAYGGYAAQYWYAAHQQPAQQAAIAAAAAAAAQQQQNGGGGGGATAGYYNVPPGYAAAAAAAAAATYGGQYPYMVQTAATPSGAVGQQQWQTASGHHAAATSAAAHQSMGMMYGKYPSQ